ncbi:hypothetical protein K443DRAFT_684991 [Laccaria amethystina LaAM-08-1]|uniref:Unplaced genomic scaffold K443scaffold_343, whole genome shotgun sequence n=1 Tax=Laccaria amethystina LaAM-08-1 TaxID=1095629 RepID=A0A0C9WIG0_9AGAR|nr:hypothetical protein K443DRAFT_684991 [Laccaria amethystina LaAM-08-1]
MPLKFPADAYQSPSIISNILQSKLYQHVRIRTYRAIPSDSIHAHQEYASVPTTMC